MKNRFFSKKLLRQTLLVLLDFLVVFISSFLALALRFDGQGIPKSYLETTFLFLTVDLLIVFIVFNIFKLYQSLWRYASITELTNVFFACTATIGTEFIYKSFFVIILPRSYYPIKYLIMLILIAVTRLGYRALRFYRDSHDKERNKIRTMVIGAGEAGSLLIKENVNSEKLKNKIVCVIDDDKNKQNIYIHGVPIVGDRSKILDNVKKFNIQEIIIAMPSVDPKKIKEIALLCQHTGCSIKVLPGVYEMVGKSLMAKVRDISYEDLLGREQVKVAFSEIEKFFEDKIVLVTGGGGSIGSELCRQIADRKPKQLIILDIYENNAYDIQMELKREHPNLDLIVIIASVQDYDRIDVIFKEYHPDYVYHAAAHKHVPLMEFNPNEAIKNNCNGTLNVVKASDKYNVTKFVLISSDKAVRPTNVMGATKRICEMIIQTYDKKSKTDFVAVRFGNVLGSNGSVIPLFLKQIETGGPVTVTHRDITRFFMTIPEAVILVLQAGVFAEGGEIFVLDMGEPVKIYNLAENLIRMKGLIPNEDIEIRITGLRPGEKLYEELLMEEEGLKETPNKLIHIGEPIEMDDKLFLRKLDNLIKLAYKNTKEIRKPILDIVDTYKCEK